MHQNPSRAQQQWSSKLNTCPISKLFLNLTVEGEFHVWKFPVYSTRALTPKYMCQKAKCINPIQKRPPPWKRTTCSILSIHWSKSHLPRVILSSSSYLLKQYFQHSSLSVHTSSWLATSPCTPFYSSNACQAVKSTKGQETKSINHHIEHRQLGKKKDDESTKHDVDGNIDIL